MAPSPGAKSRRRSAIPHFAHEAESVALQRLDQALFLTAIADGTAGRVNGCR